MSGHVHDAAVNHQDVGALFRAVRIRAGLRQADVATDAKVDRMAVSKVERGHLGGITLDRLRSIAGVLEIRLDLRPSWRGGDTARAVSERHTRMHELAATMLVRARWELATEVTFSQWGERGAIDILAWHPGRRVLLVIELKTELPDPAGLIAQVDRYRRLAPAIAADRGWHPDRVAVWVLVAESSMNRRQLARHRVMLRNAFPLDGHAFRRWLRDPPGVAGSGGGGGRGGHVGSGDPVGSGGPLAGLAFLSDAGPGITRRRLGPTRRVSARRMLPDAGTEPHRGA